MEDIGSAVGIQSYKFCRLKFYKESNFHPSSLFCHYGVTNDIFPIGGLVDVGETPIAAILRYLRELAGFRLANGYHMIPCAILDGYKDHEPIKIRLYVIDILWDHCRYRNIYHALQLGVNIAERLNSLVMNHAIPTTIECPLIEELMITVQNWEAHENKSCCFDYCELYTAYQISRNLGVDAGIVPHFHDQNTMRDFTDENGIWAAILVVLKTKMPAKELDMHRDLNVDGSKGAVNVSRFLQKWNIATGKIRLN